MRTVRFSAVVLTLVVASGCGRSGDQPPRAGEIASEAATSQSNPPASSTPQNDLAAALGVGRSLPIPEGLVPGGDCPPPPPDADQEIAAQAKAAVPLTEGLTFAYAWTRTPREEYECLIQVKKIDALGIVTTASCDAPEGRGPFLRRVCRADLRSSRMLHTVYGAVKVIGASGEEEPETITGATAFSLSSDAFAQLKRTGAFTHRYVEVESSDKLAKDGVGELRIEGRETMKLILNDRVVDVPVINTRGTMKWWIRGERLETEDTAVILDDDRFPLLIDQKDSNEKTGSRIRFAKITYPSTGRRESGGGSLAMRGGSLEDGLVDNKRVDVYGIYFDFNSDRIRAESEPVLEEIGGIMKRYPDWRLSVQGHTDNIGGNGQYNLELSQRRSAAVVSALVNRFGISASRLTSGGSGAASPKDTNDTSEGRARNRRVELVRQ